MNINLLHLYTRAPAARRRRHCADFNLEVYAACEVPFINRVTLLLGEFFAGYYDVGVYGCSIAVAQKFLF